MKILAFIFLLAWCLHSNAELNQKTIAQTLNISEELAIKLIERVTYIDRLNTSYAPYYPILSRVFLKDRGYKIGCEVGVFTGGHAKFILANTDIETLYCVDSYKAPMDGPSIITEGFHKNYWQACWETIYHYALDNLSSFGDRMQFIRLSAEQASSKIVDYSLDFVFIDGDHSYSGVLADCNNYYNKVRSGGLIAGDDYQIEDVARALHVFFEQNNLMINIYPGQTRFWWVEKP